MVTQVKAKHPISELISRCLKKDAVFFIDAKHRDQALSQLIDLYHQKYPIQGKEQLYNALLERERVASTGIGLGFALPHARLECYQDFFIMVGILNHELPWDSMDQMPVKVIFLVAGPDDKPSEYLNLLSELTLHLRDEETRKKLLTISASSQIMELFSS